MSNEEAKVNLARTYKAKVEAELTELCDTVLNLLNDYLIPNADENESKVCASLWAGRCLFLKC